MLTPNWQLNMTFVSSCSAVVMLGHHVTERAVRCSSCSILLKTKTSRTEVAIPALDPRIFSRRPNRRCWTCDMGSLRQECCPCTSVGKNDQVFETIPAFEVIHKQDPILWTDCHTKPHTPSLVWNTMSFLKSQDGSRTMPNHTNLRFQCPSKHYFESSQPFRRNQSDLARSSHNTPVGNYLRTSQRIWRR